MIVSAWILLIVFGLAGFLFTFKFLFEKLNILEVFVWFVSVIISALSAGVIWGGLTVG